MLAPSADPAAALAVLTRRGFLRGSVSGAALLLLGGAASAAFGEEPSLDVPGLDRREARVLRALAETLFEPGASGAPPSDDGVVRRAAESILALDADLVRQLRVLLFALENGPYVLGFHFKPFSSLSPAERAAYLRGWERSRVLARRMGFQAAKLLLCAAYFADERTWTFMGYDGPWIGKFELPVYPPRFGPA